MLKSHQHKNANINNFLAMNRLTSQMKMSETENYRRYIASFNLTNTAFKKFFNKLNEQNIKYIMIGCLAAAYHGCIRTCDHLEIWFEPDDKNLKRLKDALGIDLQAADETEQIISVSEEDFCLKSYLNLNYFTAKDFNWCYAKADTAIVLEIEIPVLNLDDLIVEKTASKKAEDQSLAEALERLEW